MSYRYTASYCDGWEMARPEERRWVRSVTWEDDELLARTDAVHEAGWRVESANGCPIGLGNYCVLDVRVERVTVEDCEFAPSTANGPTHVR